MRRSTCAVALCVMLLLALPALAQAGERRAAWSPRDFTVMLEGFLKYLATEGSPTGTATAAIVCSTTCNDGSTISCSGASCSKEKARCVKCGSSALFCPGTTGTNCGTATPADTNGTAVGSFLEALR